LLESAKDRLLDGSPRIDMCHHESAMEQVVV
jgi:hypothetical protein